MRDQPIIARSVHIDKTTPDTKKYSADTDRDRTGVQYTRAVRSVASCPHLDLTRMK